MAIAEHSKQVRMRTDIALWSGMPKNIQESFINIKIPIKKHKYFVHSYILCIFAAENINDIHPYQICRLLKQDT